MKTKLMNLTLNELTNIRKSNIDDYVIAEICNTLGIKNNGKFKEIWVCESPENNLYIDFFNKKDRNYYCTYLGKIEQFSDRILYEVEMGD